MSADTAEPTRLEAGVPDRLTDKEFATFQRLTREATGIQIGENKRSMIYSRFARRLRAKKMQSFTAYLELLASPNSPEYDFFINTVTTNLTFFFREANHFDYLANTVLPAIAAEGRPGRKLKVWSSASSSGQEPYSLAMILAESPAVGGWTNRLLATDIDTDMVNRTYQGIYSEGELRGLDDIRKKRWLEKLADGRYQVSDELREMMVCKQLNLFHRWPIKPPVDIIFCRNVLIYFDRPDQLKIVEGFHRIQRPGDYLFLGHSESSREITTLYRAVSNTVYRPI